MNEIAIKIENLSKQYRLGEIGTGTLSHDLNRWWHKVRRKEDPYLKIGEINNRTQKGQSDYVWALKNISFEVNKGDVVGIIGKNGAGKSTLLKILSKITKPSEGIVKVQGRIASLLEVGTGFHQEMTGRENIFMNGAIMGMSKPEIIRKFDEIVAFAGVERYIDTPVKRYSSGMIVRLGFAVAAHLEPEILVIDEVLAVGDAEFQKKAIGKMKEVSQNDGRTVLFVSHNMTAVNGLCKNGLWINDGMIHKSGDVNTIVQEYLANSLDSHSGYDLTNSTKYNYSGKLRIGKVNIYSEGCENGVVLNKNKAILKVQVLNPQKLEGYMELAGSIYNQAGAYVHYFSSKLKSKVYKIVGKAEYEITVQFEDIPLNQGTYFLGFEIKFQSEIVYSTKEDIIFNVLDNDFYNSGVSWKAGAILIDQKWS